MFVGNRLGVLGDVEGNLYLRKLDNGVLVKNLYKHKLNVTFILVEELKSGKMIFSASADGDVAIFEKDPNGDFTHFRNISLRKLSQNANMTCLYYQHKRSTLIIGTNTG